MIGLLDVLCEMTSDHEQFMFLQDHPDLLASTVGKGEPNREAARRDALTERVFFSLSWQSS